MTVIVVLSKDCSDSHSTRVGFEDELPIMPRQQVIDRAGLILGYAGVYGSFLLHAQKAAERYNVPQAEILMELGRRQVVGGQEDMIIDVALELARKHAEANE